ncbi:MAG: hypothetical protein M1830_002260 [Pleopsidium flavum]|nr:MAG: hypothetical protein M1830_002260 [Pleopsidium flavum]
MHSDEKAEAMVAGEAGGVLEESPIPPNSGVHLSGHGETQRPIEKLEERRDSSRSSDRTSEVVEAEVDEHVQDLEATSAVSTGGPVYSAFSKRNKRYIVFMTAWAGLFSPLSANIYFPALNTLAQELKVSNGLINLTLTSYMIFQGLSPTIFGDLADMAGRRPAYFIGFVIYIVANLGLALQNSYAALFLLRCLQSTGSSGTIALGNGVIADIATSAERGTYMGFALAGPMIGPAVGPILGGILSQFLGWRAIFWFLVIMSGVYLIPFLITFPETGRNVVGNGSVPPQGWNMSLLNYFETRKIEHSDALSRTVSRQEKRLAQADLASKRKLRWPNPLRTVHIILEKDVGLLLFYNSLVYTAFYDAAASLPSLFAEIYGFNDLQIGLSFIPFGVGCALASIICGRLMDWNYRRAAKNAGITIDRKRGDDMKDFPIEKARIQVALPLLYLGQACLLCYGWVLEKNAHLAAPLILQFIIGLCLTGAFNVMSILLIDLYPLSPATATAANNLVRCLMGAAGTAVIIQMIKGMGRGWCFTFITAVIFFTSPMLWVLTKMGPKWREARRVRVEKHKAEKAASHAEGSDVPRTSESAAAREKEADAPESIAKVLEHPKHQEDKS